MCVTITRGSRIALTAVTTTADWMLTGQLTVCLTCLTDWVCRVPQVDLDQARFIILSHQRSEAALSAHAASLHAELSGAARQLSSVFETLQEALEVQGGDRRALGGVVAAAEAGLGRLKGALEGAVDGQGRLLAGMSAQVGGWVCVCVGGGGCSAYGRRCIVCILVCWYPCARHAGDSAVHVWQIAHVGGGLHAPCSGTLLLDPTHAILSVWVAAAAAAAAALCAAA
jgi:hypothetical protein